jgi:hypothetical protein
VGGTDRRERASAQDRSCRQAKQREAEALGVYGRTLPIGRSKREEGTREQHRPRDELRIEEREQWHGKQGETDADRRLERGRNRHDGIGRDHGDQRHTRFKHGHL